MRVREGGWRRTSKAAAVVLTCTATCLPAPSQAQQPRPARAQLAYAHDGRLYSLAADGSGRRLLAAPGDRRFELSEPAWSPDGSAVAFVRSSRRDDGLGQVVVQDAAGTRTVSPRGRAFTVSSPSWSADGSRIVYARYGEDAIGGDRTDIVVVAGDGSDARTVVAEQFRRRGAAFLTRPVWLPDGRTIGYIRTTIDRDSRIRPSLYTVTADGGRRRLLVRGADAASWSSDGRRLAFSSIQAENGERCFSDECLFAGELYVAHADGSAARRLTRNRGDDDDPQWSPDGTRILFSSDRNYPVGQSPELHSITPSGDCLTWLTNGSPGSRDGSWRATPAGSADPGRCGAAGRRPLLEETPRRIPLGALWLGPTYRRLLLSDHATSRRDSFFAYRDCGAFRPAACPPSVTVEQRSSCRTDEFNLGRSRSQLLSLRGALVAYQGFIGGATVFSGHRLTTVTIDSGRRDARARHLAVVSDLVPGGGRARGRLPPPRLTPAQARSVRRALAARPRYSTLRETARALGLNASYVRGLLRQGRALRALGGIRVSRCPR